MIAPLDLVGSKPILIHFSPLALIGGCEVNCLRVIEGLPGYAHTVLVFDQSGPMSERWEAAGARVEHLEAWNRGAGIFASALSLWSKNRAEPSGIFYWSTSRLPVVLKALADWKIPWAVYLGNPVTDRWMQRMRLLAREFSSRAQSGITLVACSDHVAASHRSAFYFRRFSTETIYNAVSSDFDQPRVHRALPLGTAPKFGMVARLDSIKDHLTVLRALAAASPLRNDLILEFAGDGNLREVLLTEAIRLGVADRVKFLGSVKNVAALLATWDVYVHSTTAAEGMGTAVAEAMMGGLPCVVSDLSVMREVCGEEGAVYARAGDPAAWAQTLLEIFGNRERRLVLGGLAQLRARRLFALPVVAARYLKTVDPVATRGIL